MLGELSIILFSSSLKSITSFNILVLSDESTINLSPTPALLSSINCNDWFDNPVSPINIERAVILAIVPILIGANPVAEYNMLNAIDARPIAVGDLVKSSLNLYPLSTNFLINFSAVFSINPCSSIN